MLKETSPNKIGFGQGLQLGTVSLNHSLICRFLVLFGCVILTFVLISLFDYDSNHRQGRGNGNFMIVKHRMLTRRRLLKRVCHKYSNPLRPENGITLAEIQSGRFVIFNKPQFAFCQIQKCASTSFQNFFLALGRRTENKKNFIYNEAGIDTQTLEQSYKTLVVRHPFERILSAYLYFFHKTKDMDLSQSILNVIDSSAGDKDKGSRGKAEQQKMLSFKQFVTFLIRGSREAKMDPLLSRKEHLNTHWFPYWKLCSPCHPSTLPNTIVKLDEGHFQQEIEYVFQESGMAKLISATNITLGHLNPGSVGTSKNAEIYFGQLSKAQVRELHFKYRVDFEMFDYAIEPYLSYATD